MANWFTGLFKLKSKPRTGEELIVDLYVEQVCSLFSIPLQSSPKVIIVDEVSTKIAQYESVSDTIFIYGNKNVTSGVVAHEIAHSVFYKYGFINVKMSEILAGYAEYKLKDLLK